MVDASLVALARAFDAGRNRTIGRVEARSLSFDSTGIVINSYKLVLLPVWVSELHVKGQITALAVNGQTGAVFGHVPQSGWRKWVAELLGES